MNQLSMPEQVEVITLLMKGYSIRETERQTGIHRDTIMRLGARVGKACEKFLNDADIPIRPKEMLTLATRNLSVRNNLPKKEENLQSFVALHLTWSTFCRLDHKLHTTVAMRRGLTNHAWSIAELINTTAIAQTLTKLTKERQAVLILKELLHIHTGGT